MKKEKNKKKEMELKIIRILLLLVGSVMGLLVYNNNGIYKIGIELGKSEYILGKIEIMIIILISILLLVLEKKENKILKVVGTGWGMMTGGMILVIPKIMYMEMNKIDCMWLGKMVKIERIWKLGELKEIVKEEVLKLNKKLIEEKRIIEILEEQKIRKVGEVKIEIERFIVEDIVEKGVVMENKWGLGILIVLGVIGVGMMFWKGGDNGDGNVIGELVLNNTKEIGKNGEKIVEIITVLEGQNKSIKNITEHVINHNNVIGELIRRVTS